MNKPLNTDVLNNMSMIKSRENPSDISRNSDYSKEI